jgi:hypothetical protein
MNRQDARNAKSSMRDGLLVGVIATKKGRMAEPEESAKDDCPNGALAVEKTRTVRPWTEVLDLHRNVLP